MRTWPHRRLASITAIVVTSALAGTAAIAQPSPADPAIGPGTAPAKPGALAKLPKIAPSPGPGQQVPRTPARPVADEVLSPKAIDDAIDRGLAEILKLQVGQGAYEQSEWPYEGVYRVAGKIPVGYRIGGTAITARALLEAPGYDTDEARKAAVARATRFICAAMNDPLMSIDNYDAGYDVRGWGYTYGLWFLVALDRAKAIPADQADAVREATAFCLRGITQTQVPMGTPGRPRTAPNSAPNAQPATTPAQRAGWNYARPAGRDTPGAPSSFMTAATLIALHEARAAGHEVDQGMIDRALSFLERTSPALPADIGPETPRPPRTVVYSGVARPNTPLDGGRSDGLPGATGRMCVVAVAQKLWKAGHDDDLRHAVDSFITHWDELDKRRQGTGTHVPPYGVAPYYFMFAHYYAAAAVELLPEPERASRRDRITRLLMSVRAPDGTWNDRVFARSGAYGTAMALLALRHGQIATRGAPNSPMQP